MKFAFAALVFSFSTAALACPNLTGAWTCTSDSTQGALSITQKAIPNGVQYTFDSGAYTDEIYVDGAPRTSVDEDGYATTITLACSAPNAFAGTGHVDSPDQSFTIDATLTYTMTDANTFVGQTDSVVHVPDNADEAGTSTTTCVRK